MAISLESSDDGLRIPSFPQILAGLFVGILFIAFNFPIGLTKLGAAIGVPLVGEVGTTAESAVVRLSGATVIAQNVSFQALWSKLVILVLAYLAALLFLSLRHLRLDLFGVGASSLAVGTGFLHLLAWTGLLLGLLLVLLATILVWVLHLIGVVLLWIFQVLGAVFGFIGMVIGNFIAFLISSGWWIAVVALLAILLIVFIVRNRENLLEFLKVVLLPTGIFIVAAFLLIKLAEWLGPLIARLFQWLAPFFALLGRIIAVIYRIIAYVVLASAILFIIYGFGAILLDQVRGAWQSGNGRRGVILGSLAVGISLSLILVESNLYNVDAYFPSVFSDFVTTYLHYGAPIIDVLTAILIVGIAIIGILRNVPKLLQGPGLGEFQTSLVLVIVGIAVAFAVLVAAHATGDSSS